MKEGIKIKKTNQGTMYIVGDNKFRIVQNSENEFIVQRLFKTTKNEGRFWGRRTIVSEEWKKVYKDGEKYVSLALSDEVITSGRFKPFDTLESAIKWIEDFSKYPIYH